MNKFVVDRHDNILMLVRPVKKLMQSKLISDVIKTGGFFAVNMNSGELTVYRPPKIDFAAYLSEDGVYTKLSASVEEALVQLRKEFDSGNTHGKITIGKNSFYHGGESFDEFAESVRMYFADNVLKTV